MREYIFAEYVLGIQGNNAHLLRIHSHNVNSVDHQLNNLSISEHSNYWFYSVIDKE